MVNQNDRSSKNHEKLVRKSIDDRKKKNGNTSKVVSKKKKPSSDTTWSTAVQKDKSEQNTSKQSQGMKNEGEKGKKGGLSALQATFKKKLEGAKFRMINEELYTCRGEKSFAAFQKDPALFDIYHEGFREQASHWPDNPLTIIIDWLKAKHSKAIIADLGAGDAELAQSVNNKVHSFDLVSKNDRVVAADMSKLPLKGSTVNIVIFCLSLMGTNIGDFLREAHRILMPKGIMKIAEVRSRFEGEADGMKKFLRVLKRAGFDITEKPSSNKMFFIVECMKSDRAQDINDDYSAKACVYKKR
jgi:ribosomal RNA-processing protein 8